MSPWIFFFFLAVCLQSLCVCRCVRRQWNLIHFEMSSSSILESGLRLLACIHEEHRLLAVTGVTLPFDKMHLFLGERAFPPVFPEGCALFLAGPPRSTEALDSCLFLVDILSPTQQLEISLILVNLFPLYKPVHYSQSARMVLTPLMHQIFQPHVSYFSFNCV